jgi:hypothetical protein
MDHNLTALECGPDAGFLQELNKPCQELAVSAGDAAVIYYYGYLCGIWQ